MNPLQRAFEDIGQRDFDDCDELSRNELCAGRVTWVGNIGGYRLEAVATGQRVDITRSPQPIALPPEFWRGILIAAAITRSPQPIALPPEFWRGILIAAAASSVLWVGGFLTLRWWLT